MNEEKLTRRRALAGLGASSFAAAGLGFGGLALATDPAIASRHSMETEVDGNDLLFEWVETYNGETIEGPEPVTSDPPGMVLSDELGNILPGDEGSLGIRMSLQSASADSPGVTPYFAFDLHGTAENGTTEPERKAGDSRGDGGELQEHIDVTIWYDTGLLNIQELGQANLERDTGETLIADGTLAKVADDLPDSLGVDNDPDNPVTGDPLSPTGGDCLTTDNEVVIALRWEFNDAVNSEDINVTQSDSVSFDLLFGGEGGCG